MKKLEALIIIFLLFILGLLAYLLYYFYTNVEEEPSLPDKFSSIVKSINDIPADEKLYVKIKIESLSVRKINTISEDNVIGMVSLNDIYLVRDIKKGSQYYWYLIEDNEGHLGYVPSGDESLYIDTLKIKGEVEVELSKITDYVEGVEIIVPTTTTTTAPITSSVVTTSTRTTTCSKCATKQLPTTTTTTSKTTTKTTISKNQGTTIVITTSEPLQLGLKIKFNPDTKTIIAEINTMEGGKPPYQTTLSLSLNGELLETTDGTTIEVPAKSGTYTVYGKIVDANGLDVESAKDFTIEGL